MKFAFIQVEKASCPVIVLCEALEVSTSALYDWSNAQGKTISLERVSKLMKKDNLVPKTVKKFKQTTDSNHQYPVAQNRLDNGFTVDAPNKVWSTYFTYIRTDEGWLYLCIFLDLFSRRIVGWATSNRINAQLAVSALEAAIGRRNPEDGLVAHSGRGSQFCSRAYRAFCAS